MNRRLLALCGLAIVGLVAISDCRAYRTMDFMGTFDLPDLTYVGMGSCGCSRS